MYTFKKANHMDTIYQLERIKEKTDKNPIQSCILRLFDEAVLGSTPPETECALILGRVWALFGRPNDPERYEDFYQYVVSAEDAYGNILYLEIYQYSGLPSIGGPIGEVFEEFENAANELVTLISSTEPIDYEWNGTYEDYDTFMKYSVKDGVPKAEDKFSKIFES